MPQKLKVYYTKLENMGDRLNDLIIEKCFGYQVERCSFLEGEMCAIGSCLGQYTLHGSHLMRLQQRVNGYRKPQVFIWGTGFINYSDSEGKFFKKDMRFQAVRGEMTRARVEKMTGKKLDIPTADAGILASELLSEMPEKQYEVGIVPHICDLKDPMVEKLAERYKKSKVINVKEDPVQVVREIAQCKCILSSSLHGLIVADSLYIPNQYVIFSDRLLGDGYKFADYYSAYELEIKPLDLRIEPFPDKRLIEFEYKISPEVVAEKKRQIREAFPFAKETVQHRGIM